ncbi:hypothetical protein Fraau_3147 [Frateuria aurantia DSM 6220]|uniref:Uncharacterized protein n=1 Tax=Frateuria aurantia (strain ATCC 33424 / DSM 6220 / KCTC 2777 / LMG 1558 / NBRC 3245 / NCIMB 13370) TaxID=767434 RepID=H8L0H7_FRAAD|nr:hypothetical protein Fraau_3147 [Frateuria aurantia DSM 6220]
MLPEILLLLVCERDSIGFRAGQGRKCESLKSMFSWCLSVAWAYRAAQWACTIA